MLCSVSWMCRAIENIKARGVQIEDDNRQRSFKSHKIDFDLFHIHCEKRIFFKDSITYICCV